MNNTKKIPDKKQKKIEEIKESAWKIFIKNGFDNAKLSDVAKDCKMGLSSLYYYFNDKRQLVYSLMNDFKIVVNGKQLNMIRTKHISYREFIKAFINIYLEDIDKFRFFVAADSFYNYHMQYDLSDPVLECYDKQTRHDGQLILILLAGGNDIERYNKIHVCLAMILGFLRRLVLLPKYDWPDDKKVREETFANLEVLSMAIIREIGIDPDEVIMPPPNFI